MNKSQPNVPKDFRGLRWEPSNEQEVVLLFGLLIPYLPRPLAIEFIQTPFPDCKAIDIKKNEPLWIEFKLYSEEYFRVYKNRHERCDWVVCWHNDCKRAPVSPRIIALDEIVDSLDKHHGIRQYVLNRRGPGTTREQYFRQRILGLSETHQSVIRELIKFAKNPTLQLEWPKTNGACFTVRGNIEGISVEYFKVDANGRIGTPFSRWSGKKTGVFYRDGKFFLEKN